MWLMAQLNRMTGFRKLHQGLGEEVIGELVLQSTGLLIQKKKVCGSPQKEIDMNCRDFHGLLITLRLVSHYTIHASKTK
jgi:hypothetical protein